MSIITTTTIINHTLARKGTRPVLVTMPDGSHHYFGAINDVKHHLPITGGSVQDIIDGRGSHSPKSKYKGWRVVDAPQCIVK